MPKTAPEPVAVTVDLTPAQALALAQMVKRLHWSDARNLAVDDAETEQMVAAVTRLQRALADVGFAPR